MIEGIKKVNSEKEYRDLALDSSSSIKDFSIDRKRYFKKYILLETISEDDDTQSSVMGKVVETLLLEPEKFDNKFYLSACAESPTGLMLAFVEALYKIGKEVTDEDGKLTKTFEEISREAYTSSGYKLKYEAVINKFTGSDAEIYYNEIRTVRSKGLTVIAANDITNGEKIVEELKTNSITAGILNMKTSKVFQVYTQLQVEDFIVDGHRMKAMMDLVHIDHNRRTIQVYDLKCTWSVERFFIDYYLYRRSYLQAYIYIKAGYELRKRLDLEDYKIKNLKFIVCDSINYYSPLIYTLSDKDMEDAYNGFVYDGKYYPGIKEIIENLEFALSKNIWNISMKNYKLNGIIPLTE